MWMGRRFSSRVGRVPDAGPPPSPVCGASPWRSWKRCSPWKHRLHLRCHLLAGTCDASVPPSRKRALCARVSLGGSGHSLTWNWTSELLYSLVGGHRVKAEAGLTGLLTLWGWKSFWDEKLLDLYSSFSRIGPCTDTVAVTGALNSFANFVNLYLYSYI